MNLRSISNRPCATCQRDTRHHAFTCTECGQDTALKPLDPSQLPRLRDMGVDRVKKPTKVGLRKQKRIANELAGLYHGKSGRPRATTLTAKELEIATMLTTGANMAEVGRQLNISRAGVSSSVQRACHRLGLQSQWELVRYVVRQRREAA